VTARRFSSVLIANRGEIARRVMRTARRMGMRTVAVYSEADRDAMHAREADAAVCIGGPLPRESYLNIAAIVAAAAQSGAHAIHPGYGFLAESADFAQAVLDAGLIWVGPSPAAIRAMGDKAQAKRLVGAAGVPVLPGYEAADQSELALLAAAARTGYPLMIKAAAGGGGRGVRLVQGEAEFAAALAHARSEAEHAFGDGRVFLERALQGVRHVEVQVFADDHGNWLHLGERDCSVQRRHQKLIEESPGPAVDEALRDRLGQAAIAAARSVGYVGAGTVEFLLEQDGAFWFLEMNTRLQVEHPVTEMLIGLDLVEWQLRVAGGEPLSLRQDEIRFCGHAIEARLCAEDPAHGFLPQSGRLVLWVPPACAEQGAVRVEHALESGAAILPFYDSMIAKVIAHGHTRDEARERLAAALDATVALGVPTNKAFLAAVLRDDEFASRGATTDFVARRFPCIEAVQPPPQAFALAAVLVAETRARAAGYGEWTSWSNDPARVMRARLSCGDAVEGVAMRFAGGNYRVQTGGLECALEMRALDGAHARFVLATDGSSREESVALAIEGDCCHLAWAGAGWRFDDRLREPPQKRQASLSDGRLAAPINGRVVAVPVTAGDKVAAGRPLVVLEAMKIEHALTLPAAITVKAVHVAAGAQVSPGQVLVEFQPVSPCGLES
jgi:geranyl-CoA carboxylase alpha subunit